jgi:hypothetical protein
MCGKFLVGHIYCRNIWARLSFNCKRGKLGRLECRGGTFGQGQNCRWNSFAGIWCDQFAWGVCAAWWQLGQSVVSGHLL